MKPTDNTERYRASYAAWLEAEEEGREDLAELAFGSAMADLPAIEASPAFVGRAVQAAMRLRARRRAIALVARVAAAVAIAVASAGALYLFGVLVLGGLVRGTVLVADTLVWVMTSVSGGARWWSIAARVGTAVGETVSAPQTTALMAGLELVGAMAIYAFQRLLRHDGGAGDSREAGI